MGPYSSLYVCVRYKMVKKSPEWLAWWWWWWWWWWWLICCSVSTLACAVCSKLFTVEVSRFHWNAASSLQFVLIAICLSVHPVNSSLSLTVWPGLSLVKSLIVFTRPFHYSQHKNYLWAEVQIKFLIVVVNYWFQLSIPASVFSVSGQMVSTELADDTYAFCLKPIRA